MSRTLTVTLSDESATALDSAVRRGDYRDISEGVEAGIRTLLDRSDIQRALNDAWADVDAGRTEIYDPEAIIAAGRARNGR